MSLLLFLCMSVVDEKYMTYINERSFRLFFFSLLSPNTCLTPKYMYLPELPPAETLTSQ